MSSAGGVVACALAAAAALSGCFLVEESGCVADADCSAGQLCRDGACLARCDALGATVAGCVVCGDGVLVRPDEQCDDGLANSDASDACRPKTCLLPVCGDGIRDSGEACDDPAGNSDDRPDTCRHDCRLAWCGDGVLDRGEACDPAQPAAVPGSCRHTCTIVRCGDGWRDEGEACDRGVDNGRPGVACERGCVVPSTCGDGTLDAGEVCDPALVGGPPCAPTCLPATCGDGVLDAGEACDDGNTDALDACTPDCQLACGRWRQVQAARGFTLALREDGHVFGAGWNEDGELGLGTHDKRLGTPAELPALVFARIAARDRHALGLTPDGRVFAWGSGLFGETGAGVGTETVATPREVDLHGRLAIDVAAGDGVSIVWLEGGSLVMFGDDAHGELGGAAAGAPTGEPREVQIPGLVQLASTGGHVVGRTAEGAVWVWGDDTFGQLGVPDPGGPIPPFQPALPPEAGKIVEVACGETSVVLLDDAGRLFGAGSGGDGNLGNGDLEPRDSFGPIFTAAPPEAGAFQRISLGGWSTFALRDGEAWASGTNRLGQLGRGVAGEALSSPGPLQMPGGVSIDQLSGGHSHTVLLGSDGKLYGFGQLQHGALGLGLAEPTSEAFEASPIELPLWPRCTP